jgi:hypothetical protein
METFKSSRLPSLNNQFLKLMSFKIKHIKITLIFELKLNNTELVVLGTAFQIRQPV